MGASALLLSCIVLLGAGGEAGLGDPTLPPSAVSGAQPTPQPVREVQWTLALVKFSPDHRSAVLNGRVVREGDRVADARVVRILRDAVILQHRGRRIRVTLPHPPGEAVKTRAASAGAGEDR